MNKKYFLLAIVICIASVSFGQLNMTLQSNFTYPFVTSNIWGYVDTLNNEYALVGTFQGVSIVNVTVPTAPVQAYTVTGPNSNWREVKTKGKYAFVTTEGGSSGLQIINLTNLPGPVTSHFWAPTINSTVLHTIHALHVDGNYLYLYGSNIDGGATIICDVTDPWNPVYVNTYIYPGTGTNVYVHDGIVLNDTMYEGHIYGGFYAVVDVTDKLNPVLLATQNTPNNFTHNTWLSSDHKTLFTTDEVSNSFLTSYDISDLSNITELDRVQSNPGSNSIVHNTLVLNDYCVTSWYRDGVVIVDGHRPQNLVIVGNYDTYTAGAGNGFNGDWGVYPYLPSGNIVVSDIENGLFVLTPTYVRASYLEGIVRDSICGTVLSGALIEILSTTAKDYSKATGEYKTGVPGSGIFNIRISKPGYTTKIIPAVSMTATQVTNLDVYLYSSTAISITGNTHTSTLNNIGGTQIVLTNDSNTYQFVADGSGNFSDCTIQSGVYTVYAGKWGFKTTCLSNQTFAVGTNNIQLVLDSGYYDDFSLNLGWQVSGPSANSWERAVPIATLDNGSTANPGNDVSGDCGDICFVTDNGGGTQWDNDVDFGETILTSPTFDLTTYSLPILSYSRWFYNANSLNGPPADSMRIQITNGTTTVTLESIQANDVGNGTWVDKSFYLDAFLPSTNSMKLIVTIGDYDVGNVVEGGLDHFTIRSSGLGLEDGFLMSYPRLETYPNPFDNTFSVKYSFPENETMHLKLRDVVGNLIQTKDVQGSHVENFTTNGIASGIYFLSAESNNGEIVSVVKLVKTN